MYWVTLDVNARKSPCDRKYLEHLFIIWAFVWFWMPFFTCWMGMSLLHHSRIKYLSLPFLNTTRFGVGQGLKIDRKAFSFGLRFIVSLESLSTPSGLPQMSFTNEGLQNQQDLGLRCREFCKLIGISSMTFNWSHIDKSRHHWKQWREEDQQFYSGI